MKRSLVVIVLAILLAGIVRAQDDPLRVVATTTLIADVAQNIGGDLVEVTAIIPPEQDVHSFSPSPADVGAIVDADLVLVNGAFLEESLLDIIESNAEGEIVVVSNGIEILAFGGHDAEEDEAHSAFESLGTLGDDTDCEENDDAHEHGGCDPHVWTNPWNILLWVVNITDAFAKADPDNAETYHTNAEVYIQQLNDLIDELDTMIETIPEANRVLVTNHEFLAYFAAVYGFELVGTVIPSSSTLAEVDPRTLAELIEAVKAEGVPAIFTEVSANTDLAETVATEVGRDVQVVSLYSGALSDADGPASTYIDYMRYNVRAIVEALGGEMR